MWTRKFTETAAMNSDLKESIGSTLKGSITKLRKYDKSIDVLCKNANLGEEYPDQWVAVFEGKVQASNSNLDALLNKLDKMNVPRSQTVVRFIEKSPRSLLLRASR